MLPASFALLRAPVSTGPGSAAEVSQSGSISRFGRWKIDSNGSLYHLMMSQVILKGGCVLFPFWCIVKFPVDSATCCHDYYNYLASVEGLIGDRNLHAQKSCCSMLMLVSTGQSSGMPSHLYHHFYLSSSKYSPSTDSPAITNAPFNPYTGKFAQEFRQPSNSTYHNSLRPSTASS